MKNKITKKRKNNPLRIVLSLITILLLVYGISEWIPVRFKKQWEKTIVSENISQISTLVIDQPGAINDELSFSKIDSEQWQINVGNNMQNANQEKVKKMLELLKSMVAVDMIPRDKQEYQKTGLLNNQVIEVSTYNDQNPGLHFFIGETILDSLSRQYFTYIQLINDRNAYKVKGDFAAAFKLHWKSYILDPVFDLKMEDLTSMTFKYPCDSLIHFSDSNGVWKSDNNDDIDISLFHSLFEKIQAMKPYEPDENDLVWLSQKKSFLFTDQVELRFKNMDEPILLTRIILPGHPDFYYVFKISQYPYMYYTLNIPDSRLILQWEKLIKPKSKLAQKAILGF